MIQKIQKILINKEIITKHLHIRTGWIWAVPYMLSSHDPEDSSNNEHKEIIYKHLHIRTGWIWAASCKSSSHAPKDSNKK